MSSTSSTIESTIRERFPLPPKDETKRYEYVKVIAIVMACVYVYVIVLAFFGPERSGRNFNVAHNENANDAPGLGGMSKVSGNAEDKRFPSDAEGYRKV